MNVNRWLPGRRKHFQEKEIVRKVAVVTSDREEDANNEIAEAISLARRLAQHRDENNFSGRLFTAFEKGYQK